MTEVELNLTLLRGISEYAFTTIKVPKELLDDEERLSEFLRKAVKAIGCDELFAEAQPDVSSATGLQILTAACDMPDGLRNVLSGHLRLKPDYTESGKRLMGAMAAVRAGNSQKAQDEFTAAIEALSSSAEGAFGEQDWAAARTILAEGELDAPAPGH